VIGCLLAELLSSNSRLHNDKLIAQTVT